MTDPGVPKGDHGRPPDRSNATSLFSSYLRGAAGMFGDEGNRFTFLLIGTALLFMVVAAPVARLFLAAQWQWLLPCPGLLVILIAVWDRWRSPSLATQCKLGLPADGRPCHEISGCWPDRRQAEADMQSAVLSCAQSLFIAGACLNTLRDLLTQDAVVDHLAHQLMRNENFSLTVLVVESAADYLSSESGRRELPANLVSGRKTLRRFHQQLVEKVPSRVRDELIDLRTYGDRAWPRHFLLQADSVIYAGSYLCHEEGAFSYLLRLADEKVSGGLHNMFTREITYLRDNSVPSTDLRE